MMELLRAKATRTRVSEIFYLALNALLPIAVLLLIRLDPPYLSLLLVLLSKWRILALRPRFWLTNIKANLVDLLVGVSVVGLLYLSSSLLVLQILITIGYAAWLLALKPRSGAHGVMLQAGVAQFVALVTLFQFSALWPEPIILLGSWLTGYVAARHVASNYEESHFELIGALWGLFTAELSWLFYRWTVGYNLLDLPIKIPQIALIMLVIGFCAARMYHLSQKQKLTQSVLRGTILFGAILLTIILVFSPWDVSV